MEEIKSPIETTAAAVEQPLKEVAPIVKPAASELLQKNMQHTEDKPIVEEKKGEAAAAIVADLTDEVDVESEFGAQGNAANLDKPSEFDRARWRELDDDIDIDNFSEEKVFERARGYKEKYNQAATLAQANEIIEKDTQIKTWKGHVAKSDKELIMAAEAAKLRSKGRSEDEAAEQAAQLIKEYEDESPGFLKFKAREIREELEDAISAKTQHLQQQIQESRKALSLSEAPNPKLLKESIEHLGKTKDFLGLKIGSKSEQGFKDFIKPVEKGIKDGSILKAIQNDPKLLAEVALMMTYKEQFTKSITKRIENAKTKAVNSLASAPYSDGKKVAPLQTETDDEGKPKLKNPGTFK
jgi:hypothetical protein